MSDTQVVYPTRFNDALQYYGLNWEVETRPMFTFDNNGEHLLVEDAKSIVRKDIGLPLGVVGTRYLPLQNNAGGSIVDGVLAKTGGHYVKGGVFGMGRKVYLQAQLPERITIRGRDESAKLLTFLTSHDSSTQMLMGFTAVRIVCQNTYMMAMRDIRSQVVIRHTRSAEQRLETVQEILESQLVYFRELEIKANWLADQRFTDIQMDLALGKVLGYGDNDELPARTQTIRDTIMDNFTNHDDARGGNAWMAYNAFTQYTNWQKGTRGIADDAQKASRRFEGVLIGQGRSMNDEALNAIESVLAA